MTVSQLTYVIPKHSLISVHDGNGAIVYAGFVHGTKKEDPVNKMYVTRVFARDGVICVRAVEPTSKRGGRL